MLIDVNIFNMCLVGFLKEKDVCGIKWVSGYPENIKKRLPTIVGTIILNDPDTGK